MPTQRKQRILIVGAGAVSAVLSRELARDRGVALITCGARDVRKARTFIDTKDKKVRLIKLDASQLDTMSALAKDADLVINASLPDLNEVILQAALNGRANYQDLASFLGGLSKDRADLTSVEQLKFHERFKQANLVGLIGTGASPGITNLLAREAADDLDRVDTIKFRLIEEQIADRFIPSWSLTHAVHTLTTPPIVYDRGFFRVLRPFGRPEIYDFPPPFGKRQVYATLEDEVATIPRYIRVKHVDYKTGGTEVQLMRTLFELGLFGSRAITYHKADIIPLEFFSRLAPQVPSPREMARFVLSGVIQQAQLVLVVEVHGFKGKKRKVIKSTVLCPSIREIASKMPGATYISYPTGVAAAAFTRIIPRIRTAGVFPPEAMPGTLRETVLKDLRRRGLEVRRTTSDVSG